MDPLLGPVRPDPEPMPANLAGPSGSVSGPAGDVGAQTILDTWLQQLQAEQAEEPVVESRLDLDSLLSSELEFDLDFLTELSGLKGAGGPDGGVSLQELSEDLELGLLCPPDGPLEPHPLDLGPLSAAGFFPEQPPPSQPATPATRPGSVASEPTSSGRPEPSRAELPPVASISVVTNRQRGRTVVTISTRRGRQAFVLPTADLTQASRVLRALQQKRRRSRLDAAAEPEIAMGAVVKEEERLSEPIDLESSVSSEWSDENPTKKKKSLSDAKDVGTSGCDEDDQVMRDALRHLGVDPAELQRSRQVTGAIHCPESGCHMSTSSMFKMKVHILQHWNYKPYKCSKKGCNWEFFERGKLNRHETTHTQASLKCGEPGCPAAFRTRTNLLRHRLRVHGLTSPPPSPVKREQEQEQEAGTDEDTDPLSLRRFRCCRCERSFKMAAGLKRHLNWHAKDSARRTRCRHPGCEFTAADQRTLQAHERSHAEKPYRCSHPQCSWAFDSHAKLRRHLVQHTERRNYRCPYVGCEKAYRRMEYLSSHIRTHLGRFFQCPQQACGLRFVRPGSLATHIRSVHTERGADAGGPPTRTGCPPGLTGGPPGRTGGPPRLLRCPVCAAHFKSQVYLQIHMKDVHGTSSPELLPAPSADRRRPCLQHDRWRSKFDPERLDWVEDGDIVVDEEQSTEEQLTVYVPFEVETDSGPSEVLVKCDVTEAECRRLGIALEPEPDGELLEQPELSHEHVLSDSHSARETARQLRRMGVGVLPAGLRRLGHAGCARTDIVCGPLATRPRPSRTAGRRQRRPGGRLSRLTHRPDALELLCPPYGPGPAMDTLQDCQTTLEPSSLLCDSDLLGSVHNQLPHSTINLSDLT